MKSAVLLLLIFMGCISCNNISDDFFDFIFGANNVSLNQDCANRSFFDISEDRRNIEIYSVEDSDLKDLIRSIEDSSYKVNQDSEYLKSFKEPIWKPTPIQSDSIFRFIHRELEEEKNSCFSENELKAILLSEGNYFMNLEDRLGRTRMFFLDKGKSRLYYLSEYML